MNYLILYLIGFSFSFGFFAQQYISSSKESDFNHILLSFIWPLTLSYVFGKWIYIISKTDDLKEMRAYMDALKKIDENYAESVKSIRETLSKIKTNKDS